MVIHLRVCVSEASYLNYLCRPQAARRVKKELETADSTMHGYMNTCVSLNSSPLDESDKSRRRRGLGI